METQVRRDSKVATSSLAITHMLHWMHGVDALMYFYTGYNGEADDTQYVPMDHMLAASDNNQDPRDELQFMNQEEEDILLTDQQNGDVADQRIADDVEEMNALQRDDNENLLTVQCKATL